MSLHCHAPDCPDRACANVRADCAPACAVRWVLPLVEVGVSALLLPPARGTALAQAALGDTLEAAYRAARCPWCWGFRGPDARCATCDPRGAGASVPRLYAGRFEVVP